MVLSQELKAGVNAREAQLASIVDEHKGKLKQAQTEKAESKIKTESGAVQRYRKERDMLHLINALLNILPDTIDIDEQAGETLNGLARAFGTMGPQVEVNAGDTLPALLAKYADVKDVYAKLLKRAESKGLRLDGIAFVA